LTAHRASIAAVRTPHLEQLVDGREIVECDTYRRHGDGSAEDVFEVNRRVPGHGKGEEWLRAARVIQARDHERCGVEDGGERRNPGLAVVLRPEVGEQWITHVALEQLRTPAFPIHEERIHVTEAVRRVVTAENCTGSRRRAR